MNLEPITIQIQTEFKGQESDPSSQRYVYSYTITIANQSERPAQLISRHWLITDEDNGVQEVRGMGVVGEQPRLEPGQNYTYTSGVIVATEIATMEGSYQMRTDDGQEFETPIPQFMLIPPHALH